MSQPRRLDGHAMLAYRKRKRGAGRMIMAMVAARDWQQLLLMRQINVGEVYHILATIIVSAMCIQNSIRPEVSKGGRRHSCFDTSARTLKVRPKR